MAEIQDRRFTPLMKADLQEFLDWYDEGLFGRYTANLDFSNDARSNARPDDFYYQAQGQEPPRGQEQGQEEPYPARTLRQVVTITLLLFFIGELILLLVGL